MLSIDPRQSHLHVTADTSESTSMAELSRVRGADTEDQLLELQRAFLASQDHRANAAARVTRVGGVPPKAPTPEEAAGVLPEATAAVGAQKNAARAGGGDRNGSESHEAASASHVRDGRGHGAGHDEGGGGHPMETRGSSIVGEIVERARPGAMGTAAAATLAPAGPAPPTGGAGLAFPAATHRSKGPFAGRKSKFMLEREARGRGGPAGASAATATLGGPTLTFVKATPVGRKAPDPEGSGIAEETARRLAVMSVSEIEEAQEALKARLKPSALEFLKKRAESKTAGSGGGGAAESATSRASGSRGGGGAGGHERPPAIPMMSTSTSTSQQRQEKAEQQLRYERKRSGPESPAGQAASVADGEQEKRTAASAASAFFAGSGGSSTDVAEVRYTLDGRGLLLLSLAVYI